jgi:PAS domain S-box-containing protein
MQTLIHTSVLDYLFIRSAKQAIPDNDLASKQKLNLFRTFSLTAFLIALFLSVQVISFGIAELWISLILCSLTGALALNYFALNIHKRFQLAYRTVLFSSFAVLHVVTYCSGGIRNSGMMYLGGLILAAFMLLGNKEGKLLSFLSIANLIFFFVYTSTAGNEVRNIMDTDANGMMLNLDYLVTYATATLLIYSLSNNLLSSKNIVISKVLESKVQLEIINEELRKLSLVASKSDNAIIICNASGCIEWVNEGFVRTLGFSFDEAIGRPAEHLLVHDASSSSEIELLKQRIQLAQSHSGEIQCETKQGNLLWLHLSVTPVLDTQGELEQFVYVCSDITSRKKSEEQVAEYYRYLEKANKELDKFAYVVSHDLKAPLRAISNLSVWIEEDIGDKLTLDTREHFNMLKGRVNRMESLINGILDYSRADRVKSPNTEVNTAEVIEEVRDLLIGERPCEFNIAAGLPNLLTERLKFQQVVSNLISNAIKHNDKATPEIEISYREEDAFHVFSFSDNGPGIEKQFHEKIFVIFQTLKARDTFESTGVGLAIVKKIVDEIGGKIQVESEPETGSRFIVYWPKETEERYKPFQFSLQQRYHSEGNSTGIIQKYSA